MKKLLIFTLLLFPSLLCAQPSGGASLSDRREVLSLSKAHRQRSFRRSVPAGNYSGIAYLGGNRYAVVSDKADELGFFVFDIVIDTITGKIDRVASEGFVSTGEPGRDEEAIAFVPDLSTVFIASESTATVRECTLEGQLTGRGLDIPPFYRDGDTDYGLESLTYHPRSRRFWLCNEGSPVRLQSFDARLQALESYEYPLDSPAKHGKARNYAHGVSELLALDDGSLLVLEREFFVPRKKIGACVVNKIYQVRPQSHQGTIGEKRLVTQWKTSLNLLRRSLANYEGMCLGPRLADDRQVVILVSDSQNQYRGVLRDYFKSLVFL